MNTSSGDSSSKLGRVARGPLSSLTNRIFLASTLLATVSIGFAVYFVSSRLRSEVEAELQRDLNEAATLVDQQRATLFANFIFTARLIADLPKLKAAIGTDDTPTIEPIARAVEHGAVLVSELDCAFTRCTKPILAVTGTNGKTTTTELLAALVRACGHRVALAGNNAVPVSGA